MLGLILLIIEDLKEMLLKDSLLIMGLILLFALFYLLKSFFLKQLISSFIIVKTFFKNLFKKSSKIKVIYSDIIELINDELGALRLNYNADRAYICLFHNGENYSINSLDWKFSMFFEKCSPVIRPISPNYQNLKATLYWSYFLEPLFNPEKYFNKDEISEEELKSEEFFEKLNFFPLSEHPRFRKYFYNEENDEAAYDFKKEIYIFNAYPSDTSKHFHQLLLLKKFYIEQTIIIPLYYDFSKIKIFQNLKNNYKNNIKNLNLASDIITVLSRRDDSKPIIGFLGLDYSHQMTLKNILDIIEEETFIQKDLKPLQKKYSLYHSVNTILSLLLSDISSDTGFYLQLKSKK